VYILVCRIELKPPALDLTLDFFQGQRYRIRFVWCQQPHASQHPDVCGRALNIMTVKSAIERQGCAERLHVGQP